MVTGDVLIVAIVAIAFVFTVLQILSKLFDNASSRKLILLQQKKIERLEGLVEAQKILLDLYKQELKVIEEEKQ